MKIKQVITEASFGGPQDPRRSWMYEIEKAYPNYKRDIKYKDPRRLIPKDGSFSIVAHYLLPNGLTVELGKIAGNVFGTVDIQEVYSRPKVVRQQEQNPYTDLKEAIDESWIQAYKALEANGGEPTTDKPTLFLKQIAMLAKDAGLAGVATATGPSPDVNRYTNQRRDVEQVEKYIANYVSKSSPRDFRIRDMAEAVVKMLPSTPSITQMKQYSQQSQAQTTQFTQQQAMGALQHDLSMEDLIRKNKLDQADAEAMLTMDFEARQAIKERQQQMELEAKERLAKIEMDIRASKEPEAERVQALEMAKMNNAHELQVIQITAEGEYKKAKLEADYQLQIKQLENIDNAEERQNKLDVINANKAKEIGIINAETQAKIQGLRAETNAEREQSDIRVQEAFMMTFKPIWGRLIDRASELGKTLSQSISAVTGALGRLGKPVMPQAQKPANEAIERLKQLAGVKVDEELNPKLGKILELANTFAIAIANMKIYTDDIFANHLKMGGLSKIVDGLKKIYTDQNYLSGTREASQLKQELEKMGVKIDYNQSFPTDFTLEIPGQSRPYTFNIIKLLKDAMDTYNNTKEVK